MEQYLMHFPDALANEVREMIQKEKFDHFSLKASADNHHFTLTMNKTQYPVTLQSLPCIVESHKTFDDSLYYKSGDIGQIFMVDTEKKDDVPLVSGITPPTTNIVKRKYEKTQKHGPFPAEEVRNVEDHLLKLMQQGPIEEVEEELVEFQDWMIDADHPNGITIMDELEFIKQHPEYLELKSTEQQEKELKGERTTKLASSGTLAPISETNSPIQSSAAATISRDDEDDLEDDLFGDMNASKEKSPTKSISPAKPSVDLEQNPKYRSLLDIIKRLESKALSLTTEITELQSKVEASTNMIVKSRLQENLTSMEQQRQATNEELRKAQLDLEQVKLELNS